MGNIPGKIYFVFTLDSEKTSLLRFVESGIVLVKKEKKKKKELLARLNNALDVKIFMIKTLLVAINFAK